MGKRLKNAVRTAFAGATAVIIGISSISAVYAGGHKNGKGVGENYTPTVWIDPDGCEHWVMDDGWEGYMTPHVTRQGIPVCHRGNTCAVMNSDQLFATNSYQLNQAGYHALMNFFRSAGATSYIIAGHTDSRASDDYNMRLSLNRANSVAAVAQQAGVRIADVRGYGERMPRASNGTHHGMAQNRRVEIICIR